jgi:hypothetical protein
VSYAVQLITPEEKERLYQNYEFMFLYTNKAEIYGCCAKLLTEVEHVKNVREDNVYTTSENTRSHGRRIVLEEADQPMTINIILTRKLLS